MRNKSCLCLHSVQSITIRTPNTHNIHQSEPPHELYTCTTIRTPQSQNTTPPQHRVRNDQNTMQTELRVYNNQNTTESHHRVHNNQNTTKCAVAKLSWGNKGSQLWLQTAAACLSTASIFCCINIVTEQIEEEDHMWPDRQPALLLSVACHGPSFQQAWSAMQLQLQSKFMN